MFPPPPDKLRNNIIFGNRRKNLANFFPKTKIKPLFPVPFFHPSVLKEPWLYVSLTLEDIEMYHISFNLKLHEKKIIFEIQKIWKR